MCVRLSVYGRDSSQSLCSRPASVRRDDGEIIANKNRLAVECKLTNVLEGIISSVACDRRRRQELMLLFERLKNIFKPSRGSTRKLITVPPVNWPYKLAAVGLAAAWSIVFRASWQQKPLMACNVVVVRFWCIAFSFHR